MSRKTTLYTMLMVCTLVFLTASGCGSGTEESATAEEAAPRNLTTTSTASVTSTVPGTKGSVAPDFALKRLSGGELQLSSLQGKAVIVDFWDTWCPPCVKALPHLQELSVQYDQDLVVVGVAMGRQGEAKVRQFTQDKGLTFEMVLFNNDPQLIKAFGGIQSIPTTFLIDREGVIREKWVGGFGKAEYERAIKAVLGS